MISSLHSMAAASALVTSSLKASALRTSALATSALVLGMCLSTGALAQQARVTNVKAAQAFKIGRAHV